MKRDRSFAESYARFHRKLPAVLAKVTPSPSQPRAVVRRDAAIALVALGTNAAPGLPGLVSAITNARAFDGEYFTLPLQRLPYEPEEFDPALEFFSYQPDDYKGPELVRNTHSRTRMAAIVVTNGLFSTNAYAAQIAFGEVGGLLNDQSWLFQRWWSYSKVWTWRDARARRARSEGWGLKLQRLCLAF